MSYRSSHPSMPSSPKTVGSVADPALLDHPFSSIESDIIEFRLDSLLSQLPIVKNVLLKLKNSQIQTLITARCATEGGESQLNTTQRSQLIMGLSPMANFVDIELANLAEMREAASYAQDMGCMLIVSHHNFKKTPPSDQLQDIISRAVDSGAEIAKLALYHESVADIFRCAELIQNNSSIAISLMGMGPLAPSSRLLYAQLGSVLNYGYLGSKPTAPGQWHVAQLNQALQNSPQF
ncbi:MAG: 3-dehydroquinate dehydratase-1 [Rubritalea sp.]|jgi:3-dehydroquinate dehydratase-1